MGASTKYYTDKYPFLDFTNKGNSSYYISLFDGIVDYVKVSTQSSNFSNNNIIIKTNYQLIGGKSSVSKEKAGCFLFINIFNSSILGFAPGSVGLDPAKRGWKFYGNPEIEVYATKNGAGWGNAINAISSTNSDRVY